MSFFFFFGFCVQIKSVLIQLYTLRDDTVLDLACGKVTFVFKRLCIVYSGCCFLAIHLHTALLLC